MKLKQKDYKLIDLDAEDWFLEYELNKVVCDKLICKIEIDINKIKNWWDNLSDDEKFEIYYSKFEVKKNWGYK